MRAHFGQALDLGARVDTLTAGHGAGSLLGGDEAQDRRVDGICRLARRCDRSSAGKPIGILDDFGRDLGVALQMFDDLGNVIGKCEPVKTLRRLDSLASVLGLGHRRAHQHAPQHYREFIVAVSRLPDAGDLQCWMETHGLVEQTRASARAYLDRCFDNLQQRLSTCGARWSARVCDELRGLGEEIAVAYG